MTHRLRLILWSLAAGALLAAAAPGLAETVDVTVDPGRTWLGYMNVFELPVGQGAWLWGSAWGTADLPAVFTGDHLKLSPNTNVYNPNDPYWVDPNGNGAKWMSANMYVEDTSLVGKTVSFSGETLVNSFVAGYSSQAFIKVLDPSQGWIVVAQTYAPLVGGQPFSLSLDVPGTAGLVPQYGFVTDGADANPATVEQLGWVVVAPIPEPATMLLGLAVIGLLSRRR